MKLKYLFPALCALTFSSCMVGPDYVRPTAPVPVDDKYKETGDWIPAKPSDDINRGYWWKIYNDPVLDILERQVEVSNQNLKAAEAAYRQASAVADETRASLFPTIGVSAGGTTAGTLGSGTNTAAIGTGSRGGRSQTTYTAGLNASWAPDVWGRIRRQLESDEANAQVSEADLASAKLTAQATLAIDYLNLRVEDELKRLLDSNAEDDRKILQIVQNQYEVGVAAKADVLTAETQLEGVQAQAINTGVQRQQLEHAIAVLIGKPPAEFSLAVAGLRNDMPAIPTGVPSGLLQRRPDIAAAERQMAAANAEIGVQVSAYYPDITLAASLGYSSVIFSRLLDASNSLWSFGPSISETIFDAGARDAAVDIARAAYDQAVANYRQTVLTSFQQVEDNLVALHVLAQQGEVQNVAVGHAREAEALMLNQYKEGIVPYNNVLTAQTVTVSAEQASLSIFQSRLDASVGLIQALGGGWDASALWH